MEQEAREEVAVNQKAKRESVHATLRKKMIKLGEDQGVPTVATFDTSQEMNAEEKVKVEFFDEAVDLGASSSSKAKVKNEYVPRKYRAP